PRAHPDVFGGGVGVFRGRGGGPPPPPPQRAADRASVNRYRTRRDRLRNYDFVWTDDAREIRGDHGRSKNGSRESLVSGRRGIAALAEVVLTAIAPRFPH